MALNVRNIINSALRLPNIIDADDNADGTQAYTALAKLNETLAQLNADQLFPFCQRVVDYSVATPQSSYTIGTGSPAADIVEPRPTFIMSLLVFSNATAMPLKLQQMNLGEIHQRMSQQSSGMPYAFAVNEEYPNAKIYFDIKPSAGSILRIIYNKYIDRVDINDDIEIPDVYAELLITALSRKLSVMWQCQDEKITLINSLYREAHEFVTAMNARVQAPTTMSNINSPSIDSIYAWNATTY